MTRDWHKTVTSKDNFVLLVQAVPPQKSVGEATFSTEIGTPSPVHPVTLDELRSTAKKLRGSDSLEFLALLALRGALEAGDGLALANAKERLEDVYRRQQKERALLLPEDKESRKKFGEQLAPSIGLSPEESLKHYEGLRPGPRAMENPSRLFSWAVSNTICLWPQLALWSVHGKFVPAIFCDGVNHDHAMKIALFIHTFFLAPVGGLGFRICPYDGEQFFQDRPNQEYCKPAHREAHRVKRARWRKKEDGLAAQKRQKGKKNVTKKTR
jgi:hypothetical protein